MSAPINKLIDSVVKPCEPPTNMIEGVPYATHTGKLQLGEMELDVFVLNTGERMITRESMEKYFGADFLDILNASME